MSRYKEVEGECAVELSLPKADRVVERNQSPTNRSGASAAQTSGSDARHFRQHLNCYPTFLTAKSASAFQYSWLWVETALVHALPRRGGGTAHMTETVTRGATHPVQAATTTTNTTRANEEGAEAETKLTPHLAFGETAPRAGAGVLIVRSCATVVKVLTGKKRSMCYH